VREVLNAKADELGLPAENLLTPDHVRRLAWRPPRPVNEETVDAALAASGARAWQREAAVPLITAALAPADPAEPADPTEPADPAEPAEP
jgi:ribonuclease D